MLSKKKGSLLATANSDGIDRIYNLFIKESLEEFIEIKDRTIPFSIDIKTIEQFNYLITRAINYEHFEFSELYSEKSNKLKGEAQIYLELIQQNKNQFQNYT